MEVVLRGDKYLGITTREPLKKKKKSICSFIFGNLTLVRFNFQK